MNKPLRILILLLTLACAGAWQGPAYAGRLATVAGQANDQQVVDAQEFRLAEQTKITLNYSIESRGEQCAVHARIYRQLPNGDWAVVNNLRATKNDSGSRDVLLPAGDYRIEVTATHASFTVTVDK